MQQQISNIYRNQNGKTFQEQYRKLKGIEQELQNAGRKLFPTQNSTHTQITDQVWDRDKTFSNIQNSKNITSHAHFLRKPWENVLQ